MKHQCVIDNDQKIIKCSFNIYIVKKCDSFYLNILILINLLANLFLDFWCWQFESSNNCTLYFCSATFTEHISHYYQILYEAVEQLHQHRQLRHHVFIIWTSCSHRSADQFTDCLLTERKSSRTCSDCFWCNILRQNEVMTSPSLSSP